MNESTRTAATLLGITLGTATAGGQVSVARHELR
jgi:hypothetical protein